MARGWICVAALSLALGSCGDDRDPTDAKTFYHCKEKNDCLDGYDCLCGWCQKPGGAVGCDANTAPDTTPTVDAGSSVDSTTGGNVDVAQPVDTAQPDSCNVLTWAPCPKGQGCYYEPSTGKGVCEKHGNKKKNDACDNSAAPQCGKQGTTGLLCDSIDNKCYLLCDTTKTKACPAGQTCYTLEEPDKTKWPNNAGICAP